jgi:hypothetical protein
MKTKLPNYVILSFALAFLAPATNAQKLIQFWDFNQVRPITGDGGDSLGTSWSSLNLPPVDSANSTRPLTANYSVPGAGHILYSRPETHYSSSGRDSILDNDNHGSFVYDYSSSNYTYFSSSDSGFAEGNAYIKARNPSDSCVFTMYIPTTGYKRISLEFALSASGNKGPNYMIFSYSVNGGTSWKNLTTAMDTFNIGGVYRPDTLQVLNPVTVASDWYPVQLNFSSDTSVNDNPFFEVRFMLAGPNSVQGSGNVRFDNFAVLSDTGTTGINELSPLAAGYNIYPNPAQSVVNINSKIYTGNKIITLYNVVGQTVSVTENKDMLTVINTSALNAGVYFIEIKEVSTGNKYIDKIIIE